MCIIVFKPRKVSFPSREILENCFLNNDDGAGYMYAYNNRVFIRKGFMNFEDFWKNLNEDRKKVGDKNAFVMHFRITTQGGVKKHLCHPYPLSKDMNKLKWLRLNCEIGVAHNGIISLTSDSGTYTYDSSKKTYIKSTKELDHNDTMKFITDYLSLIIKDKDFYKDKDTLELIAKLCQSKLAILDGTGHCELIGNGWVKNDGCYFSNSSFQKSVFIGSGWGSYYNNTGDMFDEWEYYYNDSTKEYDFDESWCPNAIEQDDSYCTECTHRHECKLRKLKGGK